MSQVTKFMTQIMERAYKLPGLIGESAVHRGYPE